MKFPKHHYIPVFYLNQWANANGRLFKFTRPYGTAVKHSLTSPKKTGYERGLYRLPDVPEHLAEALEEKFMKQIDGRAAEALNSLISNDLKDWPHNKRHAWIRFVVGFLIRNPQAVQRAKEEFRRFIEDNQHAWRIEYDAQKKPGDKDFGSIDTINTDRVTLIALQELIDNRPLVLRISEMRWGVVDVSKTKHRLLTSDRPVIRTNGIEKPDGHLALAISPTRIFLACNNVEIERQLRQMPSKDMVRNMNKQVVRNAIKYVWSHDMSNEPLIKGQLSAEAHLDPKLW
ncbi:MAG: hypothetical protein QOF14_2253 [Hyphomicrobiales bacterium]|jgi:hypothetical protein|nr:hypothetical protein [Hyphomicrobiales bacterium]